MTETTTISLPREQRDRLKDAKKKLYKTDQVPYEIILDDLMDAHPALD